MLRSEVKSCFSQYDSLRSCCLALNYTGSLQYCPFSDYLTFESDGWGYPRNKTNNTAWNTCAQMVYEFGETYLWSIPGYVFPISSKNLVTTLITWMKTVMQIRTQQRMWLTMGGEKLKRLEERKDLWQRVRVRTRIQSRMDLGILLIKEWVCLPSLNATFSPLSIPNRQILSTALAATPHKQQHHI